VPSRALAFLRTSRLVARRAGIAGTVELVLARAAPSVFSMRRSFVVARQTAGARLHPELAPRRIEELEPELPSLFARLATTGEPEVTPFGPDELAERFAAGKTLWLFHSGGSIAGLIWTGPGPQRVAGVEFPTGPREVTIGGLVTAPAARRRGVARDGLEHVCAVLAAEGVDGLLGMVNGFNREFRAGLLRSGFRERARVYSVTVAGRVWTRVVIPGG
jgi:hypothetical protein